MARWAALLFAAGATLGIVALALPHGTGMNESVSWTTSLIGYPVALAVWAAGERVPRWIIHLCAVAGTTMITIGIHSAGPGRMAGSAAALYLWIALYSAYFFSWRETAVQVGIIAVAYGAVLSADQAPAGPALWAGLTGTVTATAVVVSSLSGRLRALALTDPLTGLPNRRGWETSLERELAGASRRHSSLCVALLDLDNFKALNDERGHLAGDRMLKVLAATWLGQLRDTDVLARYGGDEFGVILPDCAPGMAEEIVERLCAANHEGSCCSVGVAWAAPGDDTQTLIARADAALYEAKGNGGARVVHAPQSAACGEQLVD